MLTNANRAQALELLQTTRLLDVVVPEIAHLDSATWERTLELTRGLQDPSLTLAWATLFQAVDPPERARIAARRLKFTNLETQRSQWLLQHLPQVRQATTTPWPSLQRTLIHAGRDELLQLLHAIDGARCPAAEFCAAKIVLPPGEINPPPLLDGAALIAHGLPPGPRFAVLLDQVRDAQLEGEVATPAEALALVDRLMKV